jgi:SMC interacting uncharacterized protein involved in chromosome segregation
MNRCPVAITEKTLVSPTAKDFYNLFKWLYNEFIDPAYSWPSKTLVDDIQGVLRDLRYPGLDAMSKSSFSAPGDQRTWPLMLAMLSWLVDLAKVCGLALHEISASCICKLNKRRTICGKTQTLSKTPSSCLLPHGRQTTSFSKTVCCGTM